MTPIELRAVAFSYQDMRMRFDLAVAAGAWLALIGPSGGGKSTLLSLIAGFETPASGQVTIGGRDMAGVEPAARPVTTLFQEGNLFAHLSAAQNVGLGLDPRLKLDRAGRAKVAAALAEVGLAGMEERLPGQMSGGERQRVALARSLVRARPVLLLDEPFAALGPALKREMLALVGRLRQERALTVVMVTHSPEDLLCGPDRAAFVEGGRVLAEAPPDRLLAAAEPPQIAAYLGRSPIVAPAAMLAEGKREGV